MSSLISDPGTMTEGNPAAGLTTDAEFVAELDITGDTLANDNVRSLAEVSRTDARTVGSKAAILGELLAAGLPGAPGLVISAQSCAGLGATREFSPGLLENFERRLEALFPEQHWFAVRSSPIEGLRAAEQNITDTRCEYFVPRDGLTVAIIACASAPAPEVFIDSGREAAREPLQRAVIVQPMIAAEVSGVVFAGDLVDGAVSSYLIESCWGLGRALVDGQTDPDRFELGGDGNVVERQRGRKQHQIKPTGRGLLVGVDEAKRLDWTLDSDQLIKICALAKRCATLLGQAQDIEFAATGDGLVVLQSRPIDASTLAPEYVPPGIWAAYPTQLERSTQPLSTLSEDLLQAHLPDYSRFVSGHPYLNAEQISRQLPLQSDASTMAAALINPLTLTNIKASIPATLARAPFWLARTLVTMPFRLRRRPADGNYVENYHSYAEQLARDPSLDARQLLQRLLSPKLRLPRQQSPHAGHSPIALHKASFRALLYISVVKRLLQRWLIRDLEPGTLLQLFGSTENNQTSLMVGELASIATEVARDNDLRAAFAEPVTGLSLHQLVSSPVAVEESDSTRRNQFVPHFSGFLQRFGHRGGIDSELARPSWVEDPQSLLALIGVQARTTQSQTSDALDQGYRAHLLARDDLNQALPRAWQRKICKVLLERIGFYLDLQQDSRDMIAKALLLVRRRILTLEDRLLQEGKLTHSGDIFFLSWSDLNYLDSGQLSRDDAATLIAAGRDQYAARCGTVPEAILVGPKGDQQSAHTAKTNLSPESSYTTQGTADVVIGACGCSGNAGEVEGIARVVQTSADLCQLEAGEILVLASADPALLPTGVASALVCERGHALSEIAINARRQGLPTVVNAPNCSRAIATGERIRVNASLGTIEIIGPAASA